MNFTPYGTPFTGSLPAGHQFTTTKLAHQIGTAGNQVLGLISLDESGVTYLRPVDMNGGALTLNVPTNSGNNATQNQIITLPISIPGSKPGEISSQQTLQILVNPGNDKYQCVPLSLQHFQQGALTVAYSNAQQAGESIQLQVQTQDENGTVDHTTQTQQDDQNGQHNNNNNNNNEDDGPPHTVQIQHGMQTEEMVLPDVKPILTEAAVATAESGGTTQAYPVAVVAQMPPELILRGEDLEHDKNGQKDNSKDRREDVSLIIGGENYNISSWQSLASSNQSVADYLSRIPPNTLPLSLHHFLKFSADTIKREATIESSPLSAAAAASGGGEGGGAGQASGGGGHDMATSTGTGDENPDEIDPQSPAVASTVVDYLSRMPSAAAALPFSLHHFLTFPADAATGAGAAATVAIKREPMSAVDAAGKNRADGDMQPTENADDVDPQSGKPKKKKKYKKKAPKPRRPRPGQVHIATALDGTTLFCCPECNMAYSAKDLLEQHLVSHKIERRFICDICGAGLKRKEHLERHKLGHNPERPYICSVCCKGFKRKEHLNLHFVIHSGEKTEVCPECGKGFYRKDHLRKHARSHLTKRVREEISQQQAAAQLVQQVQQGQQTMSVDEGQGAAEQQGTSEQQEQMQQQHQETTVVLPTAAETAGAGMAAILHHQQQQQQQQQQHEESISHHVITLDNFQVEEPCEENT